MTGAWRHASGSGRGPPPTAAGERFFPTGRFWSPRIGLLRLYRGMAQFDPQQSTGPIGRNPTTSDSQSPPPLTPANNQPKLARNIGLLLLVIYGVGDMVGAGIYGTVGRAAAAMGNGVWLAFLVSMIAAMLTGLSYASLASRYPRAGGAAYITHRAFRLAPLSYVVGLAVAASGMTSMAAASNAFAESFVYLLPEASPEIGKAIVWAVIVVFLILLAAINIIGIRQSLWTNALCTAVEVGGLLFIIAVGIRYWGSVDYLEFAPSKATGESPMGMALVSLALSGAVLTFFSFVGFEDMLNVSEEVKEPRRTMPLGIILALAIAALLYMAVAITAVSVVPYAQLGDAANGPATKQIASVAAPYLPGWVFTAITCFAVANTALINYIMGSRLLYGMANQRLLPSPLGWVSPSRRTPYVSILILGGIVLILALSGTVTQLALATSLLLLSSFMIVNIALIVLKFRPTEPKGGFEVPVIVPALGALVSLTLIASMLMPPKDGPWNLAAPKTAGIILAVIVAMYLIMAPAAIDEKTLAEVD